MSYRRFRPSGEGFEWLGYYTLIITPAYALFCALTALGLIPVRRLMLYGIAVHLVAAPAMLLYLRGSSFLFPLVCAILWAILWYAVYRELRSQSRLERGHCPGCACDLGGDSSQSCPKCGWRRHESSAAGAAPSSSGPSTRLLLVASCLFLTAYLFTDFVVLMTSGTELLRNWYGWYVFAIPPAYALFCWLTALGLIPQQRMKTVGIAAYLVAAPAVAFSFLGLGLLLPVLAFLWYRVYRERAKSHYDRGLCPHCDYDLRGDLSQGCHECGWQRKEIPEGGAI